MVSQAQFSDSGRVLALPRKGPRESPASEDPQVYMDSPGTGERLLPQMTELSWDEQIQWTERGAGRCQHWIGYEGSAWPPGLPGLPRNSVCHSSALVESGPAEPPGWPGHRGLLDQRVAKEKWARPGHQGSSHSTSSSWGLNQSPGSVTERQAWLPASRKAKLTRQVLVQKERDLSGYHNLGGWWTHVSKAIPPLAQVCLSSRDREGRASVCPIILLAVGLLGSCPPS